MPNPYRNEKWLKFRREVIDLDGNRCSICNRLDSEGIVLQVHHKLYISGKLPWEYDYRDCETLCKGCHASEHGIIPPRFGWSFICEEDLGDLNGTCDLCGTSIRYVFIVHHPHWEPLNVGTVCCDHLTGTKIASEIMDSKQRYETRFKRFRESSRWKLIDRHLKIHQKNIDVEIVSIQSGFKICMDGYQGKSIYQSIDEAKMKIFETIENGKARNFIDSHNKI